MHAPVFAVANLMTTFIPVEYEPIAGVSEAVYVSDTSTEDAYTKVPLWEFLAISEGFTRSVAPVSPVSVQAEDWAEVATSTLPETVSEALGTEPEVTSIQAEPSRFWSTQSVVL